MSTHEYKNGDLATLPDMIQAVDEVTAGASDHASSEVTWDLLRKAQPALERAARAIGVLELYQQDRGMRVHIRSQEGTQADPATELLLAGHAIREALAYVTPDPEIAPEAVRRATYAALDPRAIGTGQGL